MILSEQHQMIRDALRDFSQQQLTPNAARWDREHEFPHDALKQLAVSVPEEEVKAEAKSLKPPEKPTDSTRELYSLLETLSHEIKERKP